MAYIKHEDLCGAFKGTFFFFNCVICLCCVCTQRSHHSSSFFLRGHAAGNPGAHRNTARSSHTRICRLCEMYICLHLATIVLLVSHWGHVSFRFSMDRGSTRSISKARPVPLRSYWSTRTLPVPPPLCCQFLLLMRSCKASQHQQPRLPLSLPLPRSTQLPLVSTFILALSVTAVTFACSHHICVLTQKHQTVIQKVFSQQSPVVKLFFFPPVRF